MKKLVLYIIRIGNDGETLLNSAPCAHCLYWIQKMGIKKVVYSAGNGQYVKANPNRLTTTHLSRSQQLFGHDRRNRGNNKKRGNQRIMNGLFN